MSIEKRVPEGSICDHCKDPQSPLTESNSQHLFQRNWKGEEITRANVHKGCAQSWAEANEGIIVDDEPLPPRPRV